MQNLFVIFAADSDGAGAGIAGIVGSLCYFFFVFGTFLATIAGWWKVFEKAGKPGWAAIVPIYQYVILLEIARKPIWWIALLLIPCVNFIGIPVVMLLIALEIAKAFGKEIGFALGLFFLPFVFYPILGFGSARYVGLPEPMA